MLMHEEFQLVIQNLPISDPILHFSLVQKLQAPSSLSTETLAITLGGCFTFFFMNLLSKQSKPFFPLHLLSLLPNCSSKWFSL
jgi:hypothetical protein